MRLGHCGTGCWVVLREIWCFWGKSTGIVGSNAFGGVNMGTERRKQRSVPEGEMLVHRRHFSLLPEGTERDFCVLPPVLIPQTQNEGTQSAQIFSLSQVNQSHWIPDTSIRG